MTILVAILVTFSVVALLGLLYFTQTKGGKEAELNSKLEPTQLASKQADMLLRQKELEQQVKQKLSDLDS